MTFFITAEGPAGEMSADLHEAIENDNVDKVWIALHNDIWKRSYFAIVYSVCICIVYVSKEISGYPTHLDSWGQRLVVTNNFALWIGMCLTGLQMGSPYFT